MRPIVIDGKAARQIPYSRETKAPIIKDWPDIASSDPKQLATWSLIYPRAVPGVLCDLWTVLDVDNLDWLHEHEHLLPTYNYRTARGRHFYFARVPHLKSSVCKIAPKVDVKTGRAGVIYWPHINGLRPVEQPPAPFPGWLLDLAASSPPVTAAGGAASLQAEGGDGKLSSSISSSSRELPILLSNSKLLVHPRSREASYAHVALTHAMNELLNARRGERNSKLNVRAYSLGRLAARGWITVEKVVQGLELACRHNQLTRDDGLEQTMATIASGLSAGMAKPYPDIRELGA
jgi:hypothetical protein